MAKKKKHVADQVRDKKHQTQKKVNPFEVKVNRQKHNVLGQKITKHDRGMPGISRSKANKKRKETLLEEYQQRFKSSKFVDKRFGEHDATLSVEDKMLKRYAMERMKTQEKGNKFNLNEDEELTHYGQSLSEIEKFEAPIGSDDEEDEDKGKIGDKIVEEEHFGGFLTKKKEEEQVGEKKSWKERMEELISKSKKEKHERQRQKEKTLELTEKVDAEWKDLHLLISGQRRGKESVEETPPSKHSDAYDIAVRELQFEMKGQASDRLKTEEELALEEKERLDKMETDRQSRMKGILLEENPSEQQKYISADDLDDGFALESSPQKRFHLSYKDGKVLGKEMVEKTTNRRVKGRKNAGPHDDEEEEDGEEGDDGEGSEEDDDESDADEDDDDDENDAEGRSASDSEDSYGDIGSEEEPTEEDLSADHLQKFTAIKDKVALINSKVKEEMITAAKKELPYTFKAPENYDDLLEILHDHSPDDQMTIVERLRKCYHPSLEEGNKQILETLFSALVQYFCDLGIQEPPQLSLVDRLTPHLYDLTQQSPFHAGQAMLEQIKDRQDEFRQLAQQKAGRGLYPALDTLLLLKLIPVLFPTSDFRHSVTTPAMLFITQMLSQCAVNHERDIASGLFLCNLSLEFVSLSGRYIPEVINFLHGLLFLASKKEPNKIEAVNPPFRPVGKNVGLLEITDTESSGTLVPGPLKISSVLSSCVERSQLNTDHFRLSVLMSGLQLLLEFSRLYANLPSYLEIFTPIKMLCNKLPTDFYPESLQDQIEKLMTHIVTVEGKSRQMLVLQKNKPKPLKLFEPLIEEVFEDKKKRSKGNKEFNDKQRLLHKYKRELKGAIREVRKDSQFLARHRLKEQLEKDSERKRKLKEIHQQLATQEGDYNAMKRGKTSHTEEEQVK